MALRGEGVQLFHLWGTLSQGLQTLFVLQSFVLYLFFFLVKVEQILFFIFQHGSLQSSRFNTGHQGFLVLLQCFFREQRPTRGDTQARFLIKIHKAFFLTELWSWNHLLLNVSACSFSLFYRHPAGVILVSMVHLNHQEEKRTMIGIWLHPPQNPGK